MKNLLIVPLTAAAVLCGCATAPTHNDQLDRAQSQVQTLSQDPMASQAASRELEAARTELSQAQTALEKHEPADEVTHLAYMATRHAEIGQARIAEMRAKEQVSQGEAERNRVLLNARTQEAERAKDQAQAQMQEAQAAKQEALAARADADTMAQQLASLRAQKTQRGMVVTLGDVLFDTGAATLKPGADLALGRLATVLQQNSTLRIIIEGHTDSRGSDAYNDELSRRRGQAVADALVSRGISSSRLEVIGRGKGYPVATNDTAAGRQQNRRVEIIFSDDSGQFAPGAEAGERG